MRLFTLTSLLACIAPLSLAEDGKGESFSTDPNNYPPGDIIERDVAIIGGGSSGSHTAVRLRDSGKSVVVIEKKGNLGGHAETYVDPNTGYTIDIGVIVFHHYQVVQDYFKRFDVPLIESPAVFSETKYVDFSTGREVPFTPPTPEAFAAALQGYSAQLAKHAGLKTGIEISYPVDPDLLLTFREFIEKYQLQDLVSLTWIVNQGYVPLLDISMLYIFKNFNAGQIDDFMRNSFLMTAHHDVQELYRKIREFLGDDALLESGVLAMRRAEGGSHPVRILVQTPMGRKLIVAKAVVCTIPPTLENLSGFDLSEEERGLFGKFTANGYYTGILNNTGLDANANLVGTGPGQEYNVPVFPGLYSMGVNQGLTQVYYGSPSVLSEDEVKADIVSIVKRVQRARGIEMEPDWLIFSSHSPFNMMVSNEEISNGFYRNLYGLQGKRNTFYHGAAWDTQDSSSLWGFTEEYLLPRILGSV